MSEILSSIRLQPRASASLFVLLCGAYGGAAVVLLHVDISAVAKLAGLGCLLLGFALAVREHVMHTGPVIVSALLTSRGSWLLQLGDGSQHEASLEANSVVLPWLTVLNFKLSPGRRRSLVLLPDNVERQAFRRLRVRLRFGR